MVGKRLMELRKKKGLSQIQLSMILNVSQAAISTYEKDQREAPDAVKLQIAEYFGVTVDYLVGKSDCFTYSQLLVGSIQALLSIPEANDELYHYIHYLNYKHRKEIRNLGQAKRSP